MISTARGYSVREYFAGKRVLVTGFTGFLGKVMVEKILRDLPDIECLYLLVRPRSRIDGSIITPEERVWSALLESPVFNRLRESWGDHFESRCRRQIRCISGDLAMEELGLSSDDLAGLRERGVLSRV